MVESDAYDACPPELRRKVLERDNYTCQKCGRRGPSGRSHYCVQVHHKTPARHGGPTTLDNLTTLCLPCHREADREYAEECRHQWLVEQGRRAPDDRAVRVTVYADLYASQRDQLDIIAAAKGVRRGDLIREAVAGWLTKNPPSSLDKC